MSRSGYSEDGPEDVSEILSMGRWAGALKSAIRGRRGQKFLLELAAAMDAMPEKVLITDVLIDDEGNCCTMGVICKSRGIDPTTIDELDAEDVGKKLDIAKHLAADIAFYNDEDGCSEETCEARWVRMRAWVAERLNDETKT